MKTLKDFLDDPIRAMAEGYEPCYLDHCALMCQRFGLGAFIYIAFMFKDAFTEVRVVQFPAFFFEACLHLIVEITLPFTFWAFALYSRWTFPARAERLRRMIEQDWEDLSQ